MLFQSLLTMIREFKKSCFSLIRNPCHFKVRSHVTLFPSIGTIAAYFRTSSGTNSAQRIKSISLPCICFNKKFHPACPMLCVLVRMIELSRRQTFRSLEFPFFI